MQALASAYSALPWTAKGPGMPANCAMAIGIGVPSQFVTPGLATAAPMTYAVFWACGTLVTSGEAENVIVNELSSEPSWNELPYAPWLKLPSLMNPNSVRLPLTCSSHDCSKLE